MNPTDFVPNVFGPFFESAWKYESNKEDAKKKLVELISDKSVQSLDLLLDLLILKQPTNLVAEVGYKPFIQVQQAVNGSNWNWQSKSRKWSASFKLSLKLKTRK